MCVDLVKSDVAPLVKGILDSRAFEVLVVSEAFRQSLSFPLAQTGIPVTLISPSGAAAIEEKHECVDNIYQVSLQRMTRWPKLYLFAPTNDPGEIVASLNMLNASIARCSLFIRTGSFHMDNVILFLNPTAEQEELIFSDKEIRRHRRTGVLTETTGSFILKRFNLYAGEVATSVLRKNSSLGDISDIFPDFDMDGYTLRVSGTPHDIFLTADKRPHPLSNKQLYENYGGFEMEMLRTVADRLNFTYVMYNPEDGASGDHINGNWTGHFLDIINERVDLVIGAIMISDHRLLVGLESPCHPVINCNVSLSPTR